MMCHVCRVALRLRLYIYLVPQYTSNDSSGCPELRRKGGAESDKDKKNRIMRSCGCVGQSGTLSVTALVAGDLLEVVVAVNAGTGALGTGLFVQVKSREDAA